MQYKLRYVNLYNKPIQYNTQWNGPSVTNPNTANCKNCSSNCSYDCTASVHNTTQNSSDNLPSYLQTTIMVQMSVGGEGVCGVMGSFWVEFSWLLISGGSASESMFWKMNVLDQYKNIICRKIWNRDSHWEEVIEQRQAGTAVDTARP